MALAALVGRIRTRVQFFPNPHLCISRSFSNKRTLYAREVGLAEFLKAVGNGVEAHTDKLANEVGELEQLLVTRTLKLKKLGIPCKHRKLILRFTNKYRLGLWRPRAIGSKL